MTLTHVCFLTALYAGTGLVLGRFYPVLSIVLATFSVACALAALQVFHPIPVVSLAMLYVASITVLQGGFLLGKLTWVIGRKKADNRKWAQLKKH